MNFEQVFPSELKAGLRTLVKDILDRLITENLWSLTIPDLHISNDVCDSYLIKLSKEEYSFV